MQVAGILIISTFMATLGTCVITGPAVTPPASHAVNAGDGADTDERNDQDEHQSDFRLAPESELRLRGSATIGSWNSVSHEINANLEPGVTLDQVHALLDRLKASAHDDDDPDANRPEAELTPSHEPTVTLTVPVTSLRSGKPGMERDMREALRAEQHPRVRYALDRVNDARWRYDEDQQHVIFELATQGELSLAGRKREIEMAVRIEPIERDRFRVIGRRTFNMADFDIEPPTALFGLIRADETVEVVFDLVVVAATSSDPESEADDAS